MPGGNWLTYQTDTTVKRKLVGHQRTLRSPTHTSSMFGSVNCTKRSLSWSTPEDWRGNVSITMHERYPTGSGWSSSHLKRPGLTWGRVWLQWSDPETPYSSAFYRPESSEQTQIFRSRVLPLLPWSSASLYCQSLIQLNNQTPAGILFSYSYKKHWRWSNHSQTAVKTGVRTAKWKGM